MPRTQLKGSQVLDGSIEAEDLAIDSVITEKIKDHNVTCDKLAVGLCERFLSTAAPIGRIRLMEDVARGVDFELPGGITYTLDTFTTRLAIYRNGQLLYSGLTPPLNDKDPVEVYPGSDFNKVKFDFNLRKGENIQVVSL
jgi:hypothetical protein